MKLGDKKREQTKAASSSTNGDWKQNFVNVSLSDEQKESIRAILSGGDFSFENELVNLVNDGYKVSCKRDSEKNTTQVQILDSEGHSGAKGKILSAWGADIKAAMCALVYKHYIILGADWNTAPQKPTDDIG